MTELLYLGRHGEGYHNVAEAQYGTAEWDAYWSKLDGDGTLYWFDAHLTDTGKSQARAAGAFMREQILSAHMPAPQNYYVSPLYRCLQTANLTWSDLKLPSDAQPFDPLIKELMREVLGEHTCDKRSSKSVIARAFVGWRFEKGFSEEDKLWEAEHRETHEEHDVRTTEMLRELFERDAGTYLSLTSHSGAIASLLRVVGHQEFRLGTGESLPSLTL